MGGGKETASFADFLPQLFRALDSVRAHLRRGLSPTNAEVPDADQSNTSRWSSGRAASAAWCALASPAANHHASRRGRRMASTPVRTSTSHHATTAAMAATTESPRPALSRHSAPDRLTVMLFATAAFLIVLVVLSSQLHTAPARPQVVLVGRVYRTNVVETVLGQRGGGTSVSRSASSPESAPAALPTPTTRVS